MQGLTFEQLPQAVNQLNKKLEIIERLLLSSHDKQLEQPEKLLTIEEASAFLHLTKQTIYSKVSRGEIPYMKRSKRLYFSRQELLDYIKLGKKLTSQEAKANVNEFLISKGGAK